MLRFQYSTDKIGILYCILTAIQSVGILQFILKYERFGVKNFRLKSGCFIFYYWADARRFRAVKSQLHKMENAYRCLALWG